MIFVLYEYVYFFTYLHHILHVMYFTKISFDMRIFSRGDRQREKESKTEVIV